MNRRSFLSGASLTLASGYLLFLQPATDEIADLQEQVDNLDIRVSALETQALGSNASEESGDFLNALDGEIVVLSGIGTEVSDPFALAAGRYRVNATVTPSSGFFAFILEMYDPNGNDELVINEFGESSGDWTGSSIYNAPMDGEYFASVSNASGQWSLEFEPF